MTTEPGPLENLARFNRDGEHRKRITAGVDGAYCVADGQEWPCDAIRSRYETAGKRIGRNPDFASLEVDDLVRLRSLGLCCAAQPNADLRWRAVVELVDAELETRKPKPRLGSCVLAFTVVADTQDAAIAQMLSIDPLDHGEGDPEGPHLYRATVHDDEGEQAREVLNAAPGVRVRATPL
jgi:hypothetical protein